MFRPHLKLIFNLVVHFSDVSLCCCASIVEGMASNDGMICELWIENCVKVSGRGLL